MLIGNREADEDCHTDDDEILRPRSNVWSEKRKASKPPKQILLCYAVKTLINNVELIIQMLNCCEYGIACSQRKEIITVTVPPENAMSN